jgi:hypothetical protein
MTTPTTTSLHLLGQALISTEKVRKKEERSSSSKLRVKERIIT